MVSKSQLQEDLKNSLKEKNELKTSVLKMVLASISNKEIEQKKKEEGLSEEEIQKVIKSEAKKRDDAQRKLTEEKRRKRLAEKVLKDLDKI